MTWHTAGMLTGLPPPLKSEAPRHNITVAPTDNPHHGEHPSTASTRCVFTLRAKYKTPWRRKQVKTLRTTLLIPRSAPPDVTQLDSQPETRPYRNNFYSPPSSDAANVHRCFVGTVSIRTDPLAACCGRAVPSCFPVPPLSCAPHGGSSGMS